MLRGFLSFFCVLTLAPTGEVGSPAPPPPERAASSPRPLTFHAVPSARPLPFYYDLYTFRGDAGRTTVVAAFAVRVGRLEEEREDWAARYRFDVTLVVADTALKSVSRTEDSVYVRVPRALDSDHLLHTQVEVLAPPSRSTVQRVVMTDASTPGIGQLYTTPFAVPDYSGSELMLSDVALGLPEDEGGWKRGDATLALLPTSQFPESSFDVYYEIYNLPTGNQYTTEVSVEHLADANGRPVTGSDPVSLRFTGESTSGLDGTLAELRRVATSLEKGRYRLTVTVTDDETGRTASASRRFHVRGWGPGTTMVPALPRRSDAAAVANVGRHR